MRASLGKGILCEVNICFFFSSKGVNFHCKFLCLYCLFSLFSEISPNFSIILLKWGPLFSWRSKRSGAKGPGLTLREWMSAVPQALADPVGWMSGSLLSAIQITKECLVIGDIQEVFSVTCVFFKNSDLAMKTALLPLSKQWNPNFLCSLCDPAFVPLSKLLCHLHILRSRHPESCAVSL